MFDNVSRGVENVAKFLFDVSVGTGKSSEIKSQILDGRYVFTRRKRF